MSVLDLLSPDSPQKQAEDDVGLKRRYRYWRIRVFYSMYIGYAFFYFTRKSFTYVMPALVADFGFDKGQLGIFGTLFAFSYGVSKFISGILSDRSNLRYFMSIGLILTGVFNLCIGVSSTALFFSLFLILNGLFQGWGSPPCAKLLTYWYSQKERGRWWGLWNTSHNIGGALIPLICAFAIQMFGWRYAIHLVGVLAILVGCFIMNRLRDKPTSLGLPPIEQFRNDYPEGTREGTREGTGEEEGVEKKLSPKEILFEHVLKNKSIWILAIAFFFIYIVRLAVSDWMLIYLMESKGYTLMVSGFCVFWLEIGGVFGSLVAGWISDTVFKGKRSPVSVLFSLGILFILMALWVVPAGNVPLVSTVIFFIGFLIFGPQVLIGMAAAELAQKEAAGTATGFIGFFAYLGAATAGYPVGKITQEYGWLGFFIFLGVCSLLVVFLLLPLWSKQTRPKWIKAG